MIRSFIALIPALALFALQEPYLVLVSYIVLGQGHFFLTYLYQYRGKKINRLYIVMYLICLPVAMWLALLLPDAVMLTAAAVLFSIHFVFDEARLLRKDNTRVSLLLLVPPVSFFLGYFLYDQFSIDLLPYLILLSVVVVAITLLRFGAQPLLSKHVLVPNILTAVVLFAYGSGLIFPAGLFLGAMIIHHYFAWYIHQYTKLYADSARLGNYITEVLFVNVLLILLFVLYTSAMTEVPWLRILFEPSFFYAWTILHILFSSQDLMRSISVRVTPSFAQR